MKLKPGIVIAPWIDPRVEVRDSPLHGRGMFARESFGSNEVVLIWGGTVFTEAELKVGKAKPGSVTLIEEGLYLGDPAGAPEADDFCLNHSCDSNLWMRDAITLVTWDVVEEDEELTIDYALWETNPTWRIGACRCGSPRRDPECPVARRSPAEHVDRHRPAQYSRRTPARGCPPCRSCSPRGPRRRR